MNTRHPVIRRRNPVAKALFRMHGGPHRTDPSRADLKRELRRQLREPKDTSCR